MERKIELGSQLFINRTDEPETVRRLVKDFAASGLKVMRLFVFWDYVERFENVWDFSRFDACFEQAAQSGVAVVPTLMPVSPPGYMRITTGVQDIGDLDDPVFWGKAMGYVRRTVQRYCNAPALHSWILWNEPSRRVRKTQNSICDFREYLRDRYDNDISRVNRLYYNRFSDFEQIEENHEIQAESLSFRGYAETADWIRFCGHNLCEKLEDIAREIRRWDTHPIHVNPHDVGRNLAEVGQSVWQEAKTVDFIGCSCHPSWHSTRFDRERLHQSVSMFSDLMRSATFHADGLFWVTELQGGNNIFSGTRAMSPSVEELTRWIWMGLGCGAEKIVFWCFNTRDEGFEGAEWGLVGLDGQPGPRLRAVREICCVLSREQPIFARVRPAKPAVYILHAETNWILSDIEGDGEERDNPRNRMLASDAVSGAYLMCQDLGVEAGFVSEELVAAGKLPADAVLIAPSVFACCDGVCEALEAFVQGGGTLIADQMFALKDGYGRIRHDRTELLERLFGVHQWDLGVLNEMTCWKLDELSCQGWFVKVSGSVTSGMARGRFADGMPAVICNRYGDGTAIRIQSAFFQRYLAHPEETSRLCLQRLLPEQAWKAPCRLTNPSSSLAAKLLSNEKEHILILFNTAQVSRQAIVELPAEARIRWIIAPDEARRQDETMYAEIGGGQTVVAHISRNEKQQGGTEL